MTLLMMFGPTLSRGHVSMLTEVGRGVCTIFSAHSSGAIALVTWLTLHHYISSQGCILPHPTGPLVWRIYFPWLFFLSSGTTGRCLPRDQNRKVSRYLWARPRQALWTWERSLQKQVTASDAGAPHYRTMLACVQKCNFSI